MDYRTFANLRLSRLGMGCLRLPLVPGNPNLIHRPQAQGVIDAALAAGINYFDTAYNYQNGDSERFLGEALQQYAREDYCLATKFYVAVSRDIRGMFRRQLRRLKTDYIDFYLLHSLDDANLDDYMNRDYLDFLLEQKQAGRIRHIGFSSHASPAALKRFLNWYDGFDMAQIQLNYLDWTMLDARGQYDLLTQHHIPVWVMEPLKGGRLTSLSPEAAAKLQAAAPGRTQAQWGLRFLLGLENVQMVLSGMSTVDQVWRNAQTFDAALPLEEAERETLLQAGQLFLKDLGVPCSACRYCCGVCPQELDIPRLLQYYNESRISAETWKLAGLDAAGEARRCLGCGACTRRCPQNIQIPAVLRVLGGGVST